MRSTVRHSATSEFYCADVAERSPSVVLIDDLRLLEALEDRIDLVDARAALAQANKKGANHLMLF
jgi:hypothetical protein